MRQNPTALLPAVLLAAILATGCGTAPRQASTPGSPAPSASGPSTLAHHEAPDYGYAGDTGPERWGELSDQWRACSTGRQQSPVDLAGGVAKNLADPSPRYGRQPITLRNTGHSIQVDLPQGSSLDHAGTTWQLRQFHLHTPSEHVVDGRAADAEVHFVHQSPQGRLLVLGVLAQQGPSASPGWSWLPTQLPKAHQSASTLPPQDLAAMLPDSLQHRAYGGSLTTPPCTEGVTWLVADAPIRLTSQQLNALREAAGPNARPVQPLNGRELLHDRD